MHPLNGRTRGAGQRVTPFAPTTRNFERAAHELLHHETEFACQMLAANFTEASSRVDRLVTLLGVAVLETHADEAAVPLVACLSAICAGVELLEPLEQARQLAANTGVRGLPVEKVLKNPCTSVHEPRRPFLALIGALPGDLDAVEQLLIALDERVRRHCREGEGGAILADMLRLEMDLQLLKAAGTTAHRYALVGSDPAALLLDERRYQERSAAYGPFGVHVGKAGWTAAISGMLALWHRTAEETGRPPTQQQLRDAAASWLLALPAVS
jgi:hypothetical protein